MKKIKLDNIKNCRGTTNWAKVKQQSDAEIEQAANKSKAAPLLSILELTQLRREE